jgi:hypothetical protein
MRRAAERAAGVIMLGVSQWSDDLLLSAQFELVRDGQSIAWGIHAPPRIPAMSIVTPPDLLKP